MKTRRKVGGKLLAGTLGLILLAAYLLTGNTGITNQNRAVYEAALDMQEQVDKIGFPDFKLADFPVAMYDGKADYVFYEGEITKRAPVLETFVGTAYPVKEHFEVIIPTLERMGSLLSMAGGVETMATGSGYEKEEHIATLWHEALHAWQLSNFRILEETAVSQKFENIDRKTHIKEGLKKEMKLLQELVSGDAMKAGNIDEIKRNVLKYKELSSERRNRMSEDTVLTEQYCELTEGTAYYIEAEVLRMEKGDSEYEERYIQSIGKYEDGRGKYYRIGMAKCLVLDQLMPQWKAEFDYSKTLDELLDAAVS